MGFGLIGHGRPCFLFHSIPGGLRMTTKLTRENWQDVPCRETEPLADYADLLAKRIIETLGQAYEFVSSGGDLATIEGGEPVDQSAVVDFFASLFESHPDWRPAQNPTVQVADEQKIASDDTALVDHYQAIREAADRVAELGAKHALLKEQASEAKKILDGAASELVCLIRRGSKRPDPQLQLPFEDAGPAKSPVQAVDPDPDMTWMDSVTTEDLGLPEGIREKLEAATAVGGIAWPLRTWGDITRWCATYQLTDIPGVGAGKADKIQASIDSYMANHQRPTAQEPEVASTQKVRLLDSIDGFDSGVSGLVKGAVFCVKSWENDSPVIVTRTGDEIALDPEDYALINP